MPIFVQDPIKPFFNHSAASFSKDFATLSLSQMNAYFAVFLLAVAPFAVFAYENAADSDLTANGQRFARDLQNQNNKKFAFAFAKRGDEDAASRFAWSRRNEQPFAFAQPDTEDYRFAFAKRREADKFARFARASSRFA
ncbi:unnamed protein product [Caenorhabditis auriculariae]|uniref:Uncharacterized protein n=1 Tax=Caenorhabditis auriculariae TaxID=2777116 RepID=A0A8S1HEI9_9PELO|nr:unnamed protein product [Caenorhabditis auriculariae]